MRRITAVFAIALLSTTGVRADEVAAPLDPEQPYSAERGVAVTYDVDYVLVVTPPYKTKQLRVWVPVPPSDGAQVVDDYHIATFPTEAAPQIAAEPVFGNRFAYFEFNDPAGAQLIRQTFRIRIHELRWGVKTERVPPVAAWPASFDKYRRSETQAVIVDDRHRNLPAQIIAESHGPAADFAATLGYALRTFRYDHVAASLRGDSLHLLETGRGHCSDYHGFCAAVGRALGYPTRITYGINTFPKASPSHCKLEAFLPTYGWVSFDVSETQKLLALIDAGTLDEAEKQRLKQAAVARLQSGYRDPTWYLQTRGSDYDLVPKASRRVPVVRTLYAEADGRPLDDPDPSNVEERRFSWMTVARFTPDRPIAYPFQDPTSPSTER